MVFKTVKTEKENHSTILPNKSWQLIDNKKINLWRAMIIYVQEKHGITNSKIIIFKYTVISDLYSYRFNINMKRPSMFNSIKLSRV